MSLFDHIFGDPKAAAALGEIHRFNMLGRLGALLDRQDCPGVVRLALQVISTATADADPELMLPFVTNLAWALAVSHAARKICRPDDVVPLLDEAIDYLGTRKEPLRLASTLNNYGTVRMHCAGGDLSHHISAAILAYDRAIELYGQAGDEHRGKLADVLIHRGAATSRQAGGDPGENLELGLSLVRRAREKFIEIGDQRGTARALSHEGRLLVRRLLGAPAANWQFANKCYSDAIRIWKTIGRTQDALEDEIHVAGTEIELSTYLPDPALLDAAIHRLQNAREKSREFNRDDLFEQATGELLFGYMQLVKRGSSADLDSALRLAEQYRQWSQEHRDVRAHRYALLTRAGILLSWCRRANDLSQCRKIYRWILQASEEFERVGDPSETAGLRFNLAEMFERQSLRPQARKLYVGLIKACEFDVRRGVALTSRSKLSDIFYRASHRLALLQALDGEPLHALATLERGIMSALPIDVHGRVSAGPEAELLKEYRTLVVAAELRQDDFANAVERNIRLDVLRQELSKILGPVPEISEEELMSRIRQVMKSGDILAVPLVGAGLGAYIFVVVNRENNLDITTQECPKLTDDAARDLLGSPGDASGKRWLGSMGLLAGELLGFSTQLASAAETIDAGCRWLGEVFGRFLAEQRGDAAGAHVLILSHGVLTMLPLHAARWTEEGRDKWLADAGPVSVIPCISVCCTSVDSRDSTKIGVVADSRGDLRAAATEAECIVRRLGEQRCSVLRGREAVFDKVYELLRSSSHLHVAAHSEFQWYAPFLSSIQLADDHNMTIADVMGLPSGETPTSVVLSSCSSGMTPGILPGGASWGFPLAFHCAGVRQVVAALWPVADLSMCLLYSEFYARFAEGCNLPEALYAARNFLRVSSYEILVQRIDEIAQGASRQWMLEDLDVVAQQYGVEAPMGNPYFWAASVCSGIAG